MVSTVSAIAHDRGRTEFSFTRFVKMAAISSINKVKILFLEFLQEKDNYFYVFARHQTDTYWSLLRKK